MASSKFAYNRVGGWLIYAVLVVYSLMLCSWSGYNAWLYFKYLKLQSISRRFPISQLALYSVVVTLLTFYNNIFLLSLLLNNGDASTERRSQMSNGALAMLWIREVGFLPLMCALVSLLWSRLWLWRFNAKAKDTANERKWKYLIRKSTLDLDDAEDEVEALRTEERIRGDFFFKHSRTLGNERWVLCRVTPVIFLLLLIPGLSIAFLEGVPGTGLYGVSQMTLAVLFCIVNGLLVHYSSAVCCCKPTEVEMSARIGCRYRLWTLLSRPQMFDSIYLRTEMENTTFIFIPVCALLALQIAIPRYLNVDPFVIRMVLGPVNQTLLSIFVVYSSVVILLQCQRQPPSKYAQFKRELLRLTHADLYGHPLNRLLLVPSIERMLRLQRCEVKRCPKGHGSGAEPPTDVEKKEEAEDEEDEEDLDQELDLRTLLKYDCGFRRFMDFLMLEFAQENLLATYEIAIFGKVLVPFREEMSMSEMAKQVKHQQSASSLAARFDFDFPPSLPMSDICSDLQTTKIHKAKALCEKYILAGGPLCVNLPARLREAGHKLHRELTEELDSVGSKTKSTLTMKSTSKYLSKVMRELVFLMSDSLARFELTAEYRDVCKQINEIKQKEARAEMRRSTFQDKIGFAKALISSGLQSLDLFDSTSITPAGDKAPAVTPKLDTILSFTEMSSGGTVLSDVGSLEMRTFTPMIGPTELCQPPEKDEDVV